MNPRREEALHAEAEALRADVEPIFRKLQEARNTTAHLIVDTGAHHDFAAPTYGEIQELISSLERRLGALLEEVRAGNYEVPTEGGHQ